MYTPIYQGLCRKFLIMALSSWLGQGRSAARAQTGRFGWGVTLHWQT